VKRALALLVLVVAVAVELFSLAEEQAPPSSVRAAQPMSSPDSTSQLVPHAPSAQLERPAVVEPPPTRAVPQAQRADAAAGTAREPPAEPPAEEAPRSPVPTAPAVAFDAGLPPRAATPERDERRFRVKWSEGLCGERSLAELRYARDQLLAGFFERRIGEAVVRHDPSLDGATLARLSVQLQRARAAVAQWVDWAPNTPPPELVVYRSAQQLRAVACASAQTVGYYDGRMHVAVDSELSEALVDQTVVHEYVHFALNTLGVPRPMWLHEGLAMHVAEETWWRNAQLDLGQWLKSDHLPFDAMVFAFPHTADEKFALAAYFQSYRMVDFIQASAGPQATRELVRRLAGGATDQDAAFAVGAGLEASTLEAHWKYFVQQ
jgi:hypothetical protein